MSEPKWKTRKYTIVGWTFFGLVVLIGVVDIILAVIDWPTFSNYVTRRTADQPLFGWIVAAILVWLLIHWFWRFIKRKE
jgi:hypothetical protein